MIYKDFNSVETLNKIKPVLKQWSKRKLTRFRRVTIIKSLALSKFVPMFLSLPNPPAELIKELEVLFFFYFLWNAGPDQYKETCYQNYLLVDY